MIEFLVGLSGGILIGATGSGMGILVTPLLVLAGYRPAVAIATGLGALAASKFVGIVTHYGLGHWPGRAAWFLVAGGAGGAGLTWWAVQRWVFEASLVRDVLLKQFLGVALLLTATCLLITAGKANFLRLRQAQTQPAAFFTIGAFVAAPVTLTSMGSGSFLTPLLVFMTDWSVAQMAATSNAFGFVVGGLSVALPASSGLFDWHLFAKVIAGLLTGLGAGVLLSRAIPRRWFARGIGAITIYLGMRMLLG
jgi:uncharacterized membrane protein YfcA